MTTARKKRRSAAPWTPAPPVPLSCVSASDGRSDGPAARTTRGARALRIAGRAQRTGARSAGGPRWPACARACWRSTEAGPHAGVPRNRLRQALAPQLRVEGGRIVRRLHAELLPQVFHHDQDTRELEARAAEVRDMQGWDRFPRARAPTW